jgi:hypothetical protein
MSSVPIEFQKILEDEKKRLLEQLAIAEAPEKARQASEQSKPGEAQQEPTPGPSVPQIKEDIVKVDELIKLCQENEKRERALAGTTPPQLDAQDQAALAVRFDEQTKAQAAAALEAKEQAAKADEQQANLRALLNEQNKADAAAKIDERPAHKAPEHQDTPSDKFWKAAGAVGQALEDVQDFAEKAEKTKKFGEQVLEIVQSLHEKSEPLVSVVAAMGFVVQSLAAVPPDPHMAHFKPTTPIERPDDINKLAETKEQREEKQKEDGENLRLGKEVTVSDDKNSREAAALALKQQEQKQNLLEGIEKSEKISAKRDANKDPEQQKRLADDRKETYEAMVETQRQRHEEERRKLIEGKFKEF